MKGVDNMDPNACIKQIGWAAQDGDLGAMADLCLDLRQWIRRGGFRPDAGETRAVMDGLGVPKVHNFDQSAVGYVLPHGEAIIIEDGETVICCERGAA